MQTHTMEIEWGKVCIVVPGEGKRQLNNNALMMQLTWPDSWEDQWVSQTRSVVERKTKKDEAVFYYRGELEHIHGNKEARAFIAEGT